MLLKHLIKTAIISTILLSTNALACERQSMHGDTQFSCQDEDCVEPYLIEHKVDEVFRGEYLEQRYNFIEYHFRNKNGYMRARTYVDEIETVVIFGPFDSRESLNDIDDDEFYELIVDYLKRRFFTIKALADDEGYNIIWELRTSNDK